MSEAPPSRGRGKRERADVLVVERGLAPSRERARALILAGKVYVGDRRVDKAGQALDRAAELRCVTPDHPWVSRGGLKLDAALTHFDVAVEGRVALDVGSSTGGFTDRLLAGGAARVHAVDVGSNQLAWKLRQDERVVVREGLHVRDLDPADLDPPPELAVIDVSFIALAKVLPHVARIASVREIVALVKPNFELEPGRVGKGGIVRDPADRAEAVRRVRERAGELGFAVVGERTSPVEGAKGNVEFLLHLRREDGGTAPSAGGTSAGGAGG